MSFRIAKKPRKIRGFYSNIFEDFRKEISSLQEKISVFRSLRPLDSLTVSRIYVFL
jgi:hypothetical protein